MTPVTPSPAATVVVLRDGPETPGGFQVFMVRRHAATPFMGGAHVFPGGRLDEGDALGDDAAWCAGRERAAANLPDLSPAEAVQYHVAAARELFEEAGVLLARDHAGRFVSLEDADARARLDADRQALLRRDTTLRAIVDGWRLRLALETLVPLAHWVTPEVESRRYDTRFFVTRLPEGQCPTHDASETTDGFWVDPAEALERCRRDEIVLPPPTWLTLKDLAQFRAAGQVLEWARRRDILTRQPRFHQEHGVAMLLMPGDPLYPVARGLEVDGERRFVLDNGRWRPVGPGEAGGMSRAHRH